MNAQPERLNRELERARRRRTHAGQFEHQLPADPEVQELARLAHLLGTTPPLQVDPHFADRLEQRVLASQTTLARPAHQWWGRFFPASIRTRPALTAALCLCLLLILLSSGVLVAAAFVTNPTNPLYALKHWEQQVQVSVAGSPTSQAELDLQTARDHLNALAGLADANHAGEYRHALEDFDQQLGTATKSVEALPTGPDHTRLAGELATLQTDARATLRGLLLKLAVPERLVTTDELGRLGDAVPQVTHVDLTLPAHPNGQAIISITGVHFQAEAQVLLDGRVVSASGALQNGGYLFTLTWKGNQHPHSIGIMNPDGTGAQTTAITIHSPADSNGNGDGGGNGNGNGNGKPGSTPTPRLTRLALSG